MSLDNIDDLIENTTMVTKDARDRRSSSSTNATNSSTTGNGRKRQLLSTNIDDKKIVQPIGICGFCLGDDQKNPNGVPEDMIHCAECGNSGHPTCLQYSEKLVKKIRTISWQCIDCKRCIVCNHTDDSLLFCDFCDSGIHAKCCNPPLDDIPEGDFACFKCQNEIKTSPKKTLIKTLSSTSTRSRRSNHSNGADDHSTMLTRPIAQFIDTTSNFFSTNKPKIKTIRQQSIQKAMKYLRDQKTNKSSKKKLLKRLDSSPITTHFPKQENQLLIRDILSSSKTSRMKKKHLNDDLSTSPQTSTPLITRQSTNKKLVSIESVTSPTRISRRSETHLNDEINKLNSSRSSTKRKNSTNSMSPISQVSTKKRTRNDSSGKQTNKKIHLNKRKDDQTEDEQSDDENDVNLSIRKQNLSIDLSKYKDAPAFIKDSLPDNITESDIYLFLDTKENSTKLISECSEKFHHSSECIDDDTGNTRWPPYIVFGSELIKTWYSSSYPQEYARVPRLYICEFCLKYMKCEEVYDRHRKKCNEFHPPANEIYHKDDLSVFEVDGNINRIYCQNLCLLAKLFLDHKTLYYDVEPFLFYVLTRNDSNGCHFIGYFSKEKHCPQKYNLSCIMVMPICQRRGYGRFLIELSYLISKKEGQVGTPERPLSTLGAQTYEAYWKIKIVEQLLNYFNENMKKCVLKSIMNETGMAADDIIETLQNLGVLAMKSNGRPIVMADVTQLEKIIKTEKIKHAHWVSIDSEYLRFTPVLTPLLLTNEEKAVEKEVKEIQIVFKEIGREAAEAASLGNESNDGSNGTNVIRYIRRRKFGHKRRSVVITRRITVHNKPNKTEISVTNDDSCAMDIIPNDDDEHSQQYVSRRRISIVNETKEVENENEKETEVEVKEDETKPLTSVPLKQTTFKQLKLDQFLKVVQPIVEPAIEESLSNSETNIQNEKTDDLHLQTRRIYRHTRLNSTSQAQTDSTPIDNELSIENSNKTNLDHHDSPIKQLDDKDLSIPSSNDNSTKKDDIHSENLSNIDRSIPIEQHSLNSINKNESIQPIVSNSITINNESQIKSNTISIEARNDQSDVLSSINSYDTTIKLVETTNNDDDDEQPPSLTCPTTMIISQSNHYNHPLKQNKQDQLNMTINNCNASTNMMYNFTNTSCSYSYPSIPNYSMQPYYYPPTDTMNYVPYYPTSTSSIYPSNSIYDHTNSEQSYFYASNPLNPISYNGNGPTPYVYSTAQSSPAAPTTGGH